MDYFVTQLSTREVKSVLGMALFCGLFGAGYKLGEVYLSQAVNREDLEVNIEALHQDTLLFKLCVQLQEFQKISRRRVHKIIIQADDLVRRDLDLQNQTLIPSEEDNVDALTWLLDIDTNLRLLLKSQRISERERASLHRLYTRIYHACMPHYRNIIRAVEKTSTAIPS